MVLCDGFLSPARVADTVEDHVFVGDGEVAVGRIGEGLCRKDRTLSVVPAYLLGVVGIGLYEVLHVVVVVARERRALVGGTLVGEASLVVESADDVVGERDGVASKAQIEEAVVGLAIAHVVEGAGIHGVLGSADTGEVGRRIVHTEDIALGSTVVDGAVGEVQLCDVALAAVEEVATVAHDVVDDRVVDGYLLDVGSHIDIVEAPGCSGGRTDHLP